MTIFALVDGNSFYCSCERVFDSTLNKRPVIVLSNNDGCAIARTAEAKALGIKMAAPYYKIRKFCRDNNVAVFSSNYPLYGDMSRRMNEVYHQFTPKVEVYSIDESFLDLTGINNLANHGQEIRTTVKQWTGIPTCVGLGPTKTLAKLANNMAKKHDELNGVCDFTNKPLVESFLPKILVSDIWGIGRASLRKLAQLNVETAAQLRDLPPRLVRNIMTVVGERTVAELNGIQCIDLELTAPAPKCCAVTRSFGKHITHKAEMLEALIHYACRAGEKLRAHNVIAGVMDVYMHTNPYNTHVPGRNVGKTVSLAFPTSDTRDLIKYVTAMCDVLWRDGYRYTKAGIFLTELKQAQQRDLLIKKNSRSAQLMHAIDSVNKRFGREAISFAKLSKNQTWKPLSELRSSSSTTDLNSLPVAKA